MTGRGNIPSTLDTGLRVQVDDFVVYPSNGFVITARLVKRDWGWVEDWWVEPEVANYEYIRVRYPDLAAFTNYYCIGGL